MEAISIDRMTPHEHGETAVLNIGDTEVIIEVTNGNRDIRIVDDDTVVKVRLGDDMSIQDVLENDRFLTAE